MEFKPLAIPEIILITPKIFKDNRGFFLESWQKKEFSDAGINTEFVQDNHSGSKKNVLRGLHYQIEHPQGKLIRAIVGEIFDVAVDIRKSSPTFGKWVGTILSSENSNILWIPRGFAHGFFALSDYAEIIYKADDYYMPQYERTILWNDAEIGINWPLINEPPILSNKDLAGIYLRNAEVFG